MISDIGTTIHPAGVRVADEAIALATARGGRLVSVNPLRDTLEDFFVAQVGQAERRALD